jgi:hypothetical protein
MIVNLERKDSLFYGKSENQSPMLSYALNSGNFVCVTTSGTVNFYYSVFDPGRELGPAGRENLDKRLPLFFIF